MNKYYLNILTIIVGLLIMGPSVILEAQTIQNQKIDVQSTKAVYLGKSKPVSELIAKSTLVKDKKSAFKATKIVPENFIGRRGESKAIRPELEHQGPDLLRQSNFGSISHQGSELFVNRDGVGLFGSPSDPSGEIGKDHYVMMVNVTQVGVYDKQGNFISSFNANTLWSEFNSVSRGDPIVLYDEEFERWILTEFTGPANLLIAVSTSSDPLGSYYAYTYQTPNFPDYPKYAIWSESLVVTTNEGGGGTLHSYFIERDSLMGEAEELNVQRIGIQGNNNTEAGFFVSTPVDWSGTTKPSDDQAMTLHLNDSSWGNSATDVLELTSYDIDYREPSNSSVSLQSITLSPYDGYPCSVFDGGFSCTPQRDGDGLDAIPEVVMNMPDYRNFGTHESLVYTFITDVTDGDNLSGIRWGELRRTAGEVWQLYQEGTFAPADGLDRYMPFVSINAEGEIGLAYSVSSEDEYVGLRYTGRLADDPLGLMTFTENIIVTGTNQINGGAQRRYGDYGQLSVDPVDGKSFWFTSEWGGSGGSDSRNRVAAFRFTRDNIDVAVTSLVAPETSSNLNNDEQISVLAFNRGVNTIDNYTINLKLNGIVVSSVASTSPLEPSASLDVTFPDLVDLSALGEYLIEVEIETNGDENLNNNLVEKTISHIANIDGAIALIPVTASCSDDFSFSLEVTNNGEATISFAEAEVSLDGTIVLTQDLFFNNLEYLESAVRNIEISDLDPGDYELSVNLVNLNQGTDEVLSNNVVSTQINQSNSLGLATLTIELDNFPTETSWQLIESSSNQIIFEGGDYQDRNSTVEEELCLSLDACYEFIILDSYEDGIIVNGLAYFIILGQDTLVQGDGDFTAQRVHNFCADNSCGLQADIEATRASSAGASDGAILITPDGVLSDYSFSIDGGLTFVSSNLFENLEPGSYQVIVRLNEDAGCTYMESVIVGPTSSNSSLESVINIDISPNPNQGYFNINLSGYDSDEVFINVEIYNNLGQKIRTGTIARYDNKYTGAFSIMDQVAGNYYIRIVDKDLQWLTKMVMF